MTSSFALPRPRIALAVAAAFLAALAVGVPAGHTAARDSDRDGMPNRWERAHGLNPHRANARANPDRDGLTNLREYRSTRTRAARTPIATAWTTATRCDDFPTRPIPTSDDDGKRDGDEDGDNDGTKNEDEDDRERAVRRRRRRRRPRRRLERGRERAGPQGARHRLERRRRLRRRRGRATATRSPNEDEDDTADDKCDGDKDKDGVDEEDKNDAVAAVVSYDDATGELVLATSDGLLTGLVTGETALGWSDCDCAELGDGPVAHLVPGALVERAYLYEGVYGEGPAPLRRGRRRGRRGARRGRRRGRGGRARRG